MRNARWLALAILLSTIGLVAGQSTNKTKPRNDKVGDTITQRIAKEAKLTDQQADKVWNAIGPAIREDLRRGKTVSVPGLGTFRVVRVAEHKDMVAGGRPVVVPAFNTVEFVGSIETNDDANAEGVTPAVEVPEFKYVPLPGQTPGQKVGRTHVPSQRVR
jgi:nucleoid DNA-binding protein